MTNEERNEMAKQHATVYIFDGTGSDYISKEKIFFADATTLIQMCCYMSNHLPTRDHWIEMEYWNGICTHAEHFRRGMMLDTQ